MSDTRADFSGHVVKRVGAYEIYEGSGVDSGWFLAYPKPRSNSVGTAGRFRSLQQALEHAEREQPGRYDSFRLDACADAIDKISRRLDAVERGRARRDTMSNNDKREAGVRGDAALFDNPQVEAYYQELRRKPTDELLKQHQNLRKVKGTYTAAEVGGKNGLITDILESRFGRHRMNYARGDAEARTDPPTSERQRRAMHAAASGKSNIGIPRDVGEEFAEADPGGKLPESKKDALT